MMLSRKEYKVYCSLVTECSSRTGSGTKVIDGTQGVVHCTEKGDKDLFDKFEEMNLIENHTGIDNGFFYEETAVGKYLRHVGVPSVWNKISSFLFCRLNNILTAAVTSALTAYFVSLVRK